MEDHNNSLDNTSDVDFDYNEVAYELEQLKELQTTKQFLEAENARLFDEMDKAKQSLDGIKLTISSTESYIDSYGKRASDCITTIESLKSKKEELVQNINKLHLKSKDLAKELESSISLKNNLFDELGSINQEKTTIEKKMDSIKTGLNEISKNKEIKIPNLKCYDSVLRQICNALVETKNRMDVATLLYK